MSESSIKQEPSPSRDTDNKSSEKQGFCDSYPKDFGQKFGNKIAAFVKRRN